jgi:hypothetical protein
MVSEVMFKPKLQSIYHYVRNNEYPYPIGCDRGEVPVVDGVALVPTTEVSAARLVTGADMPSGMMPRMPEEMSKALFATDLKDAQWASVAARLVDDSYATLNATVSGHPLDSHRAYIGLARDIPVPPALVEAMVGVLGPDLDRRTLDTGHMIMNSHPELLAAALAEVVRAKR